MAAASGGDYVRLVSKPEDYTARVAFAYPEDESMDQRWQEHLAKQEQEREEATRALTALETMNFNYQITGDLAIWPVMVFDDGSKTFIRMNPQVQHRQLPILIAIGRDGKGEMLNYRVKNDLYIADQQLDASFFVGLTFGHRHSQN